MPTDTTDGEWEKWGVQDPYYAVLTDPKFRAAALTAEARAHFFALGAHHVQEVLGSCRRYLDPAFSPQRVLEFGCGVGRLVIPFASEAKHVVGVDIADSMLEEAQRNCLERGVSNATFVRSSDDLSGVDGHFDLVHSCIVLQHIEVARGQALFERLVQRISPGGCGAIQVAIGWDLYASTFGQPPAPTPPDPPPPYAKRLPSSVRRWFRPGSKAPPSMPIAARPADPEMQMNFYNLSGLFYVLQEAGITQVHTELTNHGGVHGAFMFFRSPVAR